MSQTTYYVIAVVFSFLSLTGTIMAWVYGAAKIVIPLKEAIKYLKENYNEIKNELSDVKKERIEDKKTINSLSQENVKLVVEVKHLTKSIEILSGNFTTLTDKFDSFFKHINSQ